MWLAAILGIVIVMGMVLALYKALDRCEELNGLAQSLGLRFAPDGAPALASELSNFQLFGPGANHKTCNCLHGTVRDVEVSIFEYYCHSTCNNSDSADSQRHAVVCLRFPADMPAFRLTPEGFFDKVGNLLGFQDINFETHPVFSAQYRLVGENEAALRKAFTPCVLEFCEKQDKLCAEGRGGRLIVYRHGNLAAKNVPELLRTAMGLSELFRA